MIEEAQKYLKERGLDGWLLYDFHGNNPLARQVLQIPSHKMTMRRFFYWIPARGEPIKIVHAIEEHVLDHCPGTKKIFSSWQSLETEVRSALQGTQKIAMEYSPNNQIPYVSRVDGGTIDLIRSFGLTVVSSGDFLPHFTAVLSEKQIGSHLRAASALDQIAAEVWKWVGAALKQGQKITEYDIQQQIVAAFKERQLVTDSPPIVGVNAHSADPHYQPQKTSASPVQKGDWILIDLWAKEAGEGAVFGDITRVAVAAERPTERQEEIFQIVRRAQKAAVALIRERWAHHKRIEGWEVDDAARGVIRAAGYGDFFFHRTGHNIEVELHGSGAHMDNLEMHDVRPLLAATCFSVEPGIYLRGEFGVRLEHDVLIHKSGQVEVTGGEQDQIVCILF